jgi:hypothetical protein
MEGFLYKRGKEPKPWARRWFLLVDGRLAYYNSADDTDKAPKWSISLTDPTSASVSKEDARQLNVFVGKEVYTLRAETPADANAWAAAFNTLEPGAGASYSAPAVLAPALAAARGGAPAPSLSAFSFLQTEGGAAEPAVHAAAASASGTPAGLFDLLNLAHGSGADEAPSLASADAAGVGASVLESSGLLFETTSPAAAAGGSLFDGLMGMGGPSTSPTPDLASGAPPASLLKKEKKKIRVAKQPGLAVHADDGSPAREGGPSPPPQAVRAAGAAPSPPPSAAPPPPPPPLPAAAPPDELSLMFDGLVLGGGGGASAGGGGGAPPMQPTMAHTPTPTPMPVAPPPALPPTPPASRAPAPSRAPPDDSGSSLSESNDDDDDDAAATAAVAVIAPTPPPLPPAPTSMAATMDLSALRAYAQPAADPAPPPPPLPPAAAAAPADPHAGGAQMDAARALAQLGAAERATQDTVRELSARQRQIVSHRQVVKAELDAAREAAVEAAAAQAEASAREDYERAALLAGSMEALAGRVAQLGAELRALDAEYDSAEGRKLWLSRAHVAGLAASCDSLGACAAERAALAAAAQEAAAEAEADARLALDAQRAALAAQRADAECKAAELAEKEARLERRICDDAKPEVARREALALEAAERRLEIEALEQRLAALRAADARGAEALAAADAAIDGVRERYASKARRIEAKREQAAGAAAELERAAELLGERETNLSRLLDANAAHVRTQDAWAADASEAAAAAAAARGRWEAGLALLERVTAARARVSASEEGEGSSLGALQSQLERLRSQQRAVSDELLQLHSHAAQLRKRLDSAEERRVRARGCAAGWVNGACGPRVHAGTGRAQPSPLGSLRARSVPPSLPPSRPPSTSPSHDGCRAAPRLTATAHAYARPLRPVRCFPARVRCRSGASRAR